MGIGSYLGVGSSVSNSIPLTFPISSGTGSPFREGEVVKKEDEVEMYERLNSYFLTVNHQMILTSIGTGG